jgi:hypothetical protein
VSSGGFRADPEALRQLATRFEQAAAQLAQEIAAVSRCTQSARADTFGVLPAARAAYRLYLQKAEETHSGLRAVQGTLVGDLAAGLHADAANYLAADEGSSTGPV